MLNLLTVDTGRQYREDVSRLISWGHWFMLFNIILAMLIAMRYIITNPWPATGLGQLYLLVSWIGHFGYVGFICFLLTIFPLTFVFSNQKILRTIAILISSSIMSLLLIDTQIYQLLKFHISPHFWDLLFDSDQNQADVSWTFLFVAIPVILFLELLFSAQAWRLQYKRQQPMFGRCLAFLFVTCFLVTHLAHIWADATFYTPITAQKSNFPLSYPMTARTFLAKHGWLDLDAFKQKEKSLSEQNYKHILYPLSPIHVQPIENKPNILLIVFKGLRRDIVNDVTMPNLSRFSSQHQRFTHHIAGDNNTENSLFSLFYGLPGQYAKDMLHERRSPLLVDELQRQDYVISSFISDKLSSAYFKDGIFSGVRGKKSVVSRSSNNMQTVNLWGNWLSKQNHDRPLFSLIAFDAPGSLSIPDHERGPYQPELNSFDPFTVIDDQRNLLLINRYKNSAFYADQAFGKLIDLLYRSGSFENTVIVITSDHGFEFNESGRNSWGVGNNYSQPQLAVPMVISWPGMSKTEIHNMTTHADLATTLLQGALGVKTPMNQYTTGQSLFSKTARNWVLVGDNTQFVIVGDNETTQFDRQGSFIVYDSNNYHEIEDGKANLPMLLKVMSDLNRFRADTQQ